MKSLHKFQIFWPKVAENNVKIIFSSFGIFTVGFFFINYLLFLVKNVGIVKQIQNTMVLVKTHI
jgi:hypothetical protein